MPELSGWTGRVLCINLSNKSFYTLNPPVRVYHDYIGGRGMAGYYLRPHCTKPWDSPDMPLIFFTGPLADTDSPTSGRFTVMSISPLTEAVGVSSAGGKFGTEMKRAGWDGIIVTGASPVMCGIAILDGEVKFSDASSLAGKPLSAVFSSLPQYGSSGAAGIAAENGVRFAGISFDGNSFAGRCGLGLVMAGKGLKYIHIEGSGKTAVSDRDELNSAKEDILRLVSASPALAGEFGISEFGTGALYDLVHSRRMMPTFNFRETMFPDAEKMNAWRYRQKYETQKTGCSGCTILCKKRGKIGVSIPEYETMSHFSALIGNSDIEKVMEASRICNESGMDTISAASAIACYMEINSLDCDGFDFIRLLEEISISRGEGEMLKNGSLKFASASGKPQCSMSVKGLELPAYDPRGSYGIALAYATSTRGGCHLGAYPVSYEILRKPVATDRFSFSGKARIIKGAEDLNSIIDSLTACRFIFFGATIEEYSRVFRAVTGAELSGHDLLMAGERIYYNERVINRLNGFSAADDDLPGRFFTSGGTSGEGIDIPPINREDFLETRRRYYKIRGLTSDGSPVKEKCEELGIEWTD